jgi:hypothetical protein
MAEYQEKTSCSKGKKVRGNYPSPVKPNLQYSDKSKESISEGAALHPEIIHFLAECVFEMRTTGYDKRKD